MKSIRLMLPQFGVLVLVFAAFAGAQATRTWVSGVGDDANPCSRTAPCKTFAGSISKTASGGEIDCLDPGGFGAVTITKPMTIDCQAGLGSILAAGSLGINIADSTAGSVITLRNLTINGFGSGTSPGTTGITVSTANIIHIENVVVFGFATACLNIATASPINFSIDNSIFKDCGPNGISVSSTSGHTKGDIHNTKVWNSGAATTGISAGFGSRLAIRDSEISFAGTGISQPTTFGGSSVVLQGCTIAHNGTAVISTGANTMLLSRNVLSNNTLVFGGGVGVASTGDNITFGNTLQGPNPAAGAVI